MIHFQVITLFPDMVRSAMEVSVTGRALGQALISLDTIQLRDYAGNRYGSVDDYPYGGGAGLLIRCEPVFLAYEEAMTRVKAGVKPRVIFPSPSGRVFTQETARELAGEEELIFLCGRYEGVDDRVLQEIVTDEYTIGDYVLTGGEIPSVVMMDAISRLIPGALHNAESAETESFENGLLEYPQYTRPAEWHGRQVPGILLSGDHGKVAKWRMHESLLKTAERRPALYTEWLRERGIW